MLPPVERRNELILAFRAGSQISGPVLDRDLFNERLTQIVTARLRERDRQALVLIHSESSQGLKAARARMPEIAGEHFFTAQRLFETLSTSEEARLCAESFMCAQRAYFLYATGRYQDAIKSIDRSFANDKRLERQFGFDILLMHRIQLLNNIMRIHARRNHWRRAFTLGAVLLRYLEHPKDAAIHSLAPPWNEGWSDTLDCIPLELVRATHEQIAREQLQIFHRAEAGCKATPGFFDTRHLLTPSGSATQIQRWMNFQIARLYPAQDDYWSAATLVLRGGRMPSGPLWQSVANDVTQLLRPAMCAPAPVV